MAMARMSAIGCMSKTIVRHSKRFWNEVDPGEVYNIGGDAERTNLQVVHAICQTIDELRPNLPHRPVESPD